MATSKTFLVATAALLFAAFGLNAQPRVIHYDDATAKSAVPSFKGTVICLNFSGKLAIETKGTLMKMGARDFVEGSDCRGVTGVIRLSLSDPREMQPSSENSSVSGSIPGYSSNSSGGSSGKWIAVDATATLVRTDASYSRLGYRSIAFQAGSLTNSNSSGGNNFSNSSSFSRATPEDQAAGNAAKQALHELLHSAKSWQPGANQLLAEVFRQPPAAKITTSTVINLTDTDAINAKTADLRAQAKKIEADAKIAQSGEKEKINAEKRLKKAQEELAKAQKAIAKK